jgi:hypothetical protein
VIKNSWSGAFTNFYIYRDRQSCLPATGVNCLAQRYIEITLDLLLFSVVQGIFWLSSEGLSRSTLHLIEGERRVCTLVLLYSVLLKVEPLLIFFISLVELHFSFKRDVRPTHWSLSLSSSLSVWALLATNNVTVSQISRKAVNCGHKYNLFCRGMATLEERHNTE